MIGIIVARNKFDIIGSDGKIPWSHYADFRHFKELTLGHPVIMGRKTFESLPNGPLPHRENWVLSRDNSFRPRGVRVFPSVHNLLVQCDKGGLVWCAGGADVYRQLLPHASLVVATTILDNEDTEGLTFPTYDTTWEPVHTRTLDEYAYATWFVRRK